MDSGSGTVDDADDEAVLLALSRGGDKHAFSRLVRLYQQDVRALVRSYVRDTHDADDIAQEVFLAAYRRLGTFDGALAEDLVESADLLAPRQREIAALKRCMEGLPADKASLIGAHYAAGTRLFEIAASIGKTEGALKVALFRIRQALRNCVERKLATGDVQ